ncbi:hypothetical protein A1O1_06699 [Capronia coronata CBS 617.96]|uniref:G domain-containing protein n=1 Tax=Capronia coronata CBS 617.96 TaxID=1182541 RepID=W9Y1G5_9EURO|nr:uncharacterized protein A1O1_06699 [Capronia coronata CBS 617.96]EXJ83081.1 hypothetical protein A1O1_06699 [Capronia coronata CBS 617.96]
MDIACRVCRSSRLRKISPRWFAAANGLSPVAGLRSHRSCLSTDASPEQASPPEAQTLLDHSQRPFKAPTATSTLRSPADRQHRDAGRLPTSCPGCGALTQDVEPGEAGFYTKSRNTVKKYLKAVEYESRLASQQEGAVEEDGVPKQTTSLEEDGEQIEGNMSIPNTPIRPPVCDRCHHLIHDSRGVPIAHPSIEDIADSIAESPFSKNHVYHVLDAADFPMSLVPSIFKSLSLAKPRSQNRRSQHSFSSKPSLSFIITRSDLLGPTKDMVDKMMPKLVSILRTALGRRYQNIRLGNVHLVSSKRGWWTKDIKESIWERGGGNWLVGKFNVGKSSLFEVLFPKGSGERAPVYAELQQHQQETDTVDDATSSNFLSENSLLPPPQPEVPFPTMPLVSNLPGTTASPIRLPFGNNRGELVDLPGLERGGLDRFVRPEDRLDLVMEHRPKVLQFKIKPGQSLLLGGGLIRITPKLDEQDPSTIMLAYPFVPLKSHVTSTEKAVSAQEEQRASGVDSILAEDAQQAMAPAGKFSLQTDVTKSRAGSVIRAGVDAAKLPFKVYATDILIEGVGWVELVCQVRKYRHTTQAAPVEAEPVGEQDSNTSAVPTAEAVSIDTTGFVPFTTSTAVTEVETQDFPQVEIFTPTGRFVGQRPSLEVWDIWNSGKPRSQIRTARPRRAMSGAKKQGKKLRRAVSDP